MLTLPWVVGDRLPVPFDVPYMDRHAGRRVGNLTERVPVSGFGVPKMEVQTHHFRKA